MSEKRECCSKCGSPWRDSPQIIGGGGGEEVIRCADEWHKRLAAAQPKLTEEQVEKILKTCKHNEPDISSCAECATKKLNALLQAEARRAGAAPTLHQFIPDENMGPAPSKPLANNNCPSCGSQFRSMRGELGTGVNDYQSVECSDAWHSQPPAIGPNVYRDPDTGRESILGASTGQPVPGIVATGGTEQTGYLSPAAQPAAPAPSQPAIPSWPPPYWQCPNDESHILELPKGLLPYPLPRCERCNVTAVLRGKPTPPAPEPGVELVERNNYVAWLCFRGGRDGDSVASVHTCDSNYPGAFKVYRWSVIDAALIKVIAKVQREANECEWCDGHAVMCADCIKANEVKVEARGIEKAAQAIWEHFHDETSKEYSAFVLTLIPGEQPAPVKIIQCQML